MRCGRLSSACWRHAVPRFRHQYASLRRCSSQAPSSGRQNTEVGRASDVFKKGRAFSLERAIETQQGLDHQLWDTSAFQFSVYPDLPKFMQWSDLLTPRKLLASSGSHPVPGTAQDHYIVRTAGVQLRTPSGIARRLLERAGVSHEGRALPDTCQADALLLVSGSQALRPVLSWIGALQDSVAALKIACKQREQGLLSHSLSLWAVSNPLRDSPDSVLRKVDAGAEVILTQPPLLRRQFEAWYEGLTRSRVTDSAKIVIGTCMLTSARSTDFWLRLCNARHLDGAEALMAAFGKAEEAGKSALQQHCYQHTKQQIRQVLELPEVAGLHVMPVSKAGRRLAMQLASEKEFRR